MILKKKWINEQFTTFSDLVFDMDILGGIIASWS